MSRAWLSYGGRAAAPAAPAEGVPAVSVRGLSVRYPGAPAWALRELDWQVQAGQRVALVGPNGSGKSTLLRAIAGVLPPAAGSVRVFGQPVGGCRSRVGYLEQRSALDWRFPLSLRRLVLSGRYVHLGWFRRPGREDRAAVERELRRLGLADLADRAIGDLSGGQQQRALLARALVQQADLLLLDEPMNAVDAQTRAILATLLDELRGEGKTVLIATHELDGLERAYDQVLYLQDGRVVSTPAAAPCACPCHEQPDHAHLVRTV